MARKILLLTLIAATTALSACNTVRGAGRDIESAADSVDRAF